MANYMNISDSAQSFLVEFTDKRYDTLEVCVTKTDNFGNSVGIELDTAGIAKIIKAGKALQLNETHVDKFRQQFPTEAV